MIRYTVVTGWRSPADGVAGLGGLTVQAHCLRGYSHYPPPQPPAQVSPNERVILWLALENGNGARARSYCWRDIPTCTLRSLVWSMLLFCNKRLRIMVVRTRVSSGGSVEGCCGFLIWQGWQTLSVPAWTEVVSSGGAPTPAGTSVITKHNWDMGMGYLWLNGWGIYHLMGGAFMT